MIPAALACFALGFLGGFSFGFKVAAMIRLGVQQVLSSPAPVDPLLTELEEVGP